MKCDKCGEEMRWVPLAEVVHRNLDEDPVIGELYRQANNFFDKYKLEGQNYSTYECANNHYVMVHTQLHIRIDVLERKYEKLKAFL